MIIYLKDKLRAVLYRIERRLGIDAIYMTKGTFWTTFRFAIGTVTSMVTVVAFANLLSRESYGTYSYLLSLAGSLAFLSLSGTGTGVIRATARGHANVLPYAIRLQLRYNLLTVTAIAIAAIYYQANGNSTFAISLGILAIALPLASVYHTYESVFIGQKRFDILTAVTGATNVVATISTVVVLLLTDNLILIVSSYALVSVVPNLLAYIYVKRSVAKSEPEPEAIKELRRTAFHLTGAGIISTLAQYLDKIVLFQVAGPAALAIYGFSIAGPEKLKGLVKNWFSIALPRLTERSTEEIRQTFYKRILYSLAIGSGVTLVAILLAPVLFHLFLPRYLDAIPYSQVYSLGLIVIPAMVYVGSVFSGQNMLRAIYINSIGSQIIRIVLFLILGLKWQIWGLIAASIISYIISTIYCIIIWEIESRRLIRKKA